MLDTDTQACNGMVPHPHLPLFASYGIDDDVKIVAPYGARVGRWEGRQEEEVLALLGCNFEQLLSRRDQDERARAAVGGGVLKRPPPSARAQRCTRS